MGRVNPKWFFAIGLFWLIIVVAFVGVKEYTLATGEEVVLKTRPVDPRDLFRGDYVILSYDISMFDPEAFGKFTSGQTVYVGLKRADVIDTISSVSLDKPDDLFLKGKVVHTRGSQMTVEYGIESYFVPEGTGWDIQGQMGRGLTAKVVIDKSGNAVIRELLFEGKPL